jgi:hypothetical protein
MRFKKKDDSLNPHRKRAVTLQIHGVGISPQMLTDLTCRRLKVNVVYFFASIKMFFTRTLNGFA